MFGLLLNLALVSASILSRNVQQPAEAEALDGSSITVLPGGAGLRATGLLSMHRRRDVATSTLYQRQLMSDIAQDHKSHSSQQTQHKHQKSKSGSNTQNKSKTKSGAASSKDHSTSSNSKRPPRDGSAQTTKQSELPDNLGANDGQGKNRDAGIYYQFKSPHVIKEGQVFDGHGATFDLGRSCNNQAETGDSEAVFLLLEGASLINAIIGPLQSQGIRCIRGRCKITNVHFPDVCEDAITIKGDATTSYITDSSFHGAVDKAIQVNGCDTVIISGCTFDNVGKSVRSCGDCSNNGQGCSRKIKIINSQAKNTKTFLALNSNYGDSGEISNNVFDNVQKVCEDYKGVTNHQGNSKDLGKCGSDVVVKNNQVM